MTPAIRAAKKSGIYFKTHEYPHDASASSYGEEAARLLKIDPDRVFKTLLVADNEDKLAVAIVPVSHQLQLKAVAKRLKVKKVVMANPHEAEKATGYIWVVLARWVKKSVCLLLLMSQPAYLKRCMSVEDAEALK